MANWSYNGTVLPDFPTDFGSYTDQYAYRVIVWEEKRQRWYALASARAFEIRDNGSGWLCLYATDHYGQYYLPLEGTAWEYVGRRYSSGSALTFGDSFGYHMVWANHDIINRVDGSVALPVSDPVSPGSVITKLEVNAAELRLNRGESFQFAAEVEGTGIYSKRILYSLSGNDRNGGTTLTSDGLLTVGATEHSSVFTVTVASRQDLSVCKEVTVTVADYQSKLSLNLVTDLYHYNSTVLPEFPTDFGAYSDGYVYRVIVWEEWRQRWYALASARRFEIRDNGSGRLCLYATDYHGQYYLPLGKTAWEYVGRHYNSGSALTFGDSFGYHMVWANHDIISRVDESVFFKRSEPVRLCTPVSTGEETAYQVIGSGVRLDGACIHLNTTDTVYTVKAWLYRLVDGLNTQLPPTWTSEVFGGPAWAQRISFSDLMPFTRYGVYVVVCVDGVATDHHWQGTFTTLQASTAVSLAVEAQEVKADGCILSITRSGLDPATEYIAEVIVYHPDSSRVIFVGEIRFFGDGTDTCTVTGLEPGILYAVSVDVYPDPTGVVVVRSDSFVTTAPEQTGWPIYAGVSGLARPVRAIYVGVNGRARRVKGVYVGVNGRAQPISGG